MKTFTEYLTESQFFKPDEKVLADKQSASKLRKHDVKGMSHSDLVDYGSHHFNKFNKNRGSAVGEHHKAQWAAAGEEYKSRGHGTNINNDSRFKVNGLHSRFD